MSRIVFHRPARVAPPQLPTDPVVVAAPPQPIAKDSGANWLMLLMPLLSSISMAAYMIVAGKKMLILLGISFVLLSIGLTFGVRMQMRGTQRKQRLGARDRYLEHLVEIRKTARQVASDQRTVAAWQHPSPHRLWAIARRRRRVWERRPSDPDFLQIRIGTGRAPLSTPVRLATRNDPTVEYDTRAKAAADRLIENTSSVGHQPATVDLDQSGVISVVGPAGRARGVARALLSQVAVLHAPDDVCLTVVTGGSEDAQWEWAKWLPHTHEEDATGEAGVVPLVAEDFDGVADHLAAWLTAAHEQAAAARRTFTSGREAAANRRRLVVLLDGYDPRSAWARSAVATQLLADAGPGTGVTVVCVVSREADEPTRADVRVHVDDEGRLRIENRRNDNRGSAYVDGAVADEPSPVLCAATARALAPLRLSAEGEEILAQTMSLPNLLGVPDLDSFDPEDLWIEPDSEDVLRFPVGFDAEGKPLALDLKEAAQSGMGPHGLVVGATGSGKSELLRTLVGGLTAIHSPDILSFVLVDFKGGATFAGVTELPHVAGLITNLVDDLALVDRVRDALQGEQQRRQKLLRDAGNLDNVREYQLRRAAGQTGPDGKPLEPLPYLLVIVDEFGELLSSRPDFIDLFVQIGRVGRSLGIHLLLATQRLEEGKLRGLESNLSYRICLRTFSAAESRAVIGTPDAYQLPPIPGSAYLKVADSVYERFRVAHVSGPHESAEDRDAVEGPVSAAPVPFGLRHAPDPDAEPVPEPERRSRPLLTGPTEMQVLVERLLRSGQAVHQVWLPPLPRALPLDALTGPLATTPDLPGLRAQWWPEHGSLKLPVGVADIPVMQQQHPVVPDFAHEYGHLALIGAPQSGKSMFLRTLMLSAMATHSPDEIQFLCVDFGGGALAPFDRAPHVSGVVGRHDVERVQRALAEVSQLLTEREQLFRELGIDSAEEFRRRRAAGELPDGVRSADIFLLLDNWAGVRGEMLDRMDIDATVLDIAARGLGVGIHMVVTANRWADLRMALRDSIAARLELRLNDPAESEIDRRAARRFASATAPGRGLAPGGVQFQVALPRLDGMDTLDGLADAQQDALTKIADSWPTAAAPPIRMLPERITLTELAELPAASDRPAAGVAIGVAEQDLLPVHLELTDADPHFLVFGDSGSGKSAFLRSWLTGMTERHSAWEARFIVIDYRRSLLGIVPDEHLGAYAGDATAAAFYAEQVAEKLAERLPPADVTHQQLRDRDWWEGPELYVVVDDYDLVAHGRQSPLAPLVDYLPQARELGFHLVVARRVSGFARTAMTDPMLTRARELGASGLVLSGDTKEGAVLGSERAEPRVPGRGVLVQRRAPRTVVQLALTEADAAEPGGGY